MAKILIEGNMTQMYYGESDSKYATIDALNHIGILDKDNCDVEIVSIKTNKQTLETVCEMVIEAIFNVEEENEDEICAIMGDYIVTDKFGDVKNVTWEILE